jgi:arginine/lysine/histidine/glutamine transport system substrate-binding and permease protein
MTLAIASFDSNSADTLRKFTVKRSVFIHQGLIGIGVVTLLGACRNAQSAPESEPPAQLPKLPNVEFPLNKTWKVATATGFYPFVQQPQANVFEGFDIDLLNALATIAGAKVAWQTMPFDSLIPAVQVGKVDMAIGAIAITEERTKSIHFSESYFLSGVAIATKADRSDIKSLKTLENKTIAIPLGTAAAQIAIDIPGSKLKSYNSAFSTLQAVADGSVDAALCDLPLILGVIHSGQIPHLKRASGLLTEESFGIAMTKKNPENLAAINKALKQLRSSSQFREIYQKWFGTNPID